MKHIGKSYPIHDAENKASGRALYAGDMKLQNMLYMAILFSPIPHGFVKSINCEKAYALPGVVEILHCFNIEHNEYNRYHTQLGQELVHNEKIFNEHVRFVGDRIAGVVAVSEEIARQAVKLIDVEYEELPYALTPEETLSKKIDNVHRQGAVYEAVPTEIGNKNTEDDLVKISCKTHLSRINHVCMETHACVAVYDKYLKELTVYSPNQTVFGIRSVLAEMFDMDYNKIRVVKTTMGGSFGAKQEWILEPAAAAAAIKTGSPVKLVYNRDETIVSTICRSPMNMESTLECKPDGKFINLECDLVLDAGSYLGNSLSYATTFGTKLSKLYKFDYINYKGRAVITNTIVSGAFRGWTSPEVSVMLEHSINMAAKRLGIDEVEIRLKNVMEAGDVDAKSNISIGNFKAKETLLVGREKFDWDKRKKEVLEFNKSSKRYKRGVGVGLGGHVSSFYPAKTDFARVEMRMTESGTVKCNVTLHDHGCGTVTAFKMIAAEALDLSIDDIKIGEGDSDVTPFDIGCFSSRTTYVIGRATYECALKLKERIKKHFSELESVAIEDVDTKGKLVFCKSNPELCYTFTELVFKSQQIYKHEIVSDYEIVADSNALVAGAHFALVEVDTYTGMTKILDYVAVQDVGTAINREICIAQTQGAVIMGSGAALCEHVKYKSDGTPFASLKDYHLINSFEAPNVRVELIEDGKTEGPYGAKSIGEACHVPVAAAIVGAVNHALNSELNSIPLTPDVITKYLAERGN